MRIDGSRMRGIRERRLWSQTELAERAGLTRPTISRLENGRDVIPRTVREVARALEVDAEDLLIPVQGGSPVAAESSDRA